MSGLLTLLAGLLVAIAAYEAGRRSERRERDLLDRQMERLRRLHPHNPDDSSLTRIEVAPTVDIPLDVDPPSPMAPVRIVPDPPLPPRAAPHETGGG